jgi:hypothetical protein
VKPAGCVSPAFGQEWSWKRDLNTRPADYESAALPTELFQQRLFKISGACRKETCGLKEKQTHTAIVYADIIIAANPGKVNNYLQDNRKLIWTAFAFGCIIF